MKLKLCITSFCLFIGGLFISNAQVETRVGAMLAYGSEIENIGIGATAEFGILEKLSIAPSFIYYLPKEEGPIKWNWWELNADANYYFLQDEGFQLFGLAGINYSQIEVKSDVNPAFGGGSYEVSDGKIGLNLGAGVNLDLGGNIMPFANLKYVIIDDGQLVVGAGVKFKI